MCRAAATLGAPCAPPRGPPSAPFASHRPPPSSRVPSTERSSDLTEDAMSDQFRIEKDSLGEMKVPADALYAAQTQRAVENFPISGIRFPRRFIHAMGTIKKAAAQANQEMGLLDGALADAIVRAADEVIEGTLDGQFVLDVFQTGSGTSTNMNTNEVIGTRATQLVGGSPKVHPNDHVNMGQSSNDVIPTAMHVSARVAVE